MADPAMENAVDNGRSDSNEKTKLIEFLTALNTTTSLPLQCPACFRYYCLDGKECSIPRTLKNCGCVICLSCVERSKETIVKEISAKYSITCNSITCPCCNIITCAEKRKILPPELWRSFYHDSGCDEVSCVSLAAKNMCEEIIELVRTKKNEAVSIALNELLATKIETHCQRTKEDICRTIDETRQMLVSDDERKEMVDEYVAYVDLSWFDVWHKLKENREKYMRWAFDYAKMAAKSLLNRLEGARTEFAKSESEVKNLLRAGDLIGASKKYACHVKLAEEHNASIEKHRSDLIRVYRERSVHTFNYYVQKRDPLSIDRDVIWNSVFDQSGFEEILNDFKTELAASGKDCEKKMELRHKGEWKRGTMKRWQAERKKEKESGKKRDRDGNALAIEREKDNQ